MDDSLPLAEPVASSTTLDPLHPSSPPAPPYPLAASTLNPDKLATLGPWYHTLGIVLLLLVYAFVANLTHHHTIGGAAASSRVQQTVNDAARAFSESPKVPLYGSTMMLSWLLLSAVVAGLYHRRAFFRTTLRRRFRSLWIDPAIGLAIYLSFLTCISILVILFTTVLMVRANHAHPKPTTGSAQTQSATNPNSNDTTASATQRAQDVQQHVQRLLHVNHEAVAALAPHTVPELLLWICLSFTAGFCEEHIFRGYLLSQCLAAMRRLAMPSWLAGTLSVIATSVLFGSLHLYEGVGGAVMIGLLGALLATMTLVLGNLRAVIIAHFLQDFLGGLAYYIAHLRHAV